MGIGSFLKKASGVSSLGKLVKGDLRGAFDESLGGTLVNKAMGYDPDKDIGKQPDAGTYFGEGEADARDDRARALGIADGKAIREPDAVAAENIRAARTEGPLSTQAHDAGAIERAAVERVGAPGSIATPFLPDAEKIKQAKAGAVREAEGATIGPAALQRSTQVGKVDTDNTLGASLLRQAATGEAPSKAEALLHSGLDEVAQKQLSLAAGATGNQRRGAKLAAMLAIGQQGAEAANKAAGLRADEMAQGRGALSSFEQHGQDIKQQATSLQAQIDSAAARGDADAVNRLKTQQADLNARADEVNAGAQNTRDESDANREQRANELNASATDARARERATDSLRVQEGNVDRTFRADDANAGRATSASMADAAAANRRAEDLTRRQDENDQQYATRVQAWREANAGREQDASKTNAANELTGETETGRLRQAADSGNVTAKLNALSGARASTGDEVGIASTKYGADNAKYLAAKAAQEAARNARDQMVLKAGSALASGGATLAVPGGMPALPGGSPKGLDDNPIAPSFATPSDARLKKDVKRPAPKETIRLADAYKKMFKTYEYKNGDGETTGGVMGQELEKDPLGKKFVRKDAQGVRSVDYNGLNAAVLAGLAAKMDASAQRSAKGRRS